MLCSILLWPQGLQPTRLFYSDVSLEAISLSTHQFFSLSIENSLNTICFCCDGNFLKWDIVKDFLTPRMVRCQPSEGYRMKSTLLHLRKQTWPIWMLAIRFYPSRPSLTGYYLWCISKTRHLQAEGASIHLKALSRVFFWASSPPCPRGCSLGAVWGLLALGLTWV